MKRLIAILFLTLFILQSYANPRPQQNPISNDIDTEGSTNVDASGINTGSNDNQLYIKPGNLQRNPTFYQDIFNIPISTLQAVSNFLTTYSNPPLTNPPSTNAGLPTETPVLSKDDQLISFLKSSPVSQLSGETPTPITSTQNQANAGLPFGQIAQDIKQGLLIRLPTFYQDILRIPISTLQAVSNFLTTHYTSANATVPKLPTNAVNEITKNDQVQLETSGVSTSIDTSLNAPVVVNAADDNQLNTKQGYVHRNPTFYQDIFKIPISTLQAVSNLFSSGYTNTSIAKTDSTNKENNKDQSSLKSSQSSEQVSMQAVNQHASKVEIQSQHHKHVMQGSDEHKEIEQKVRAERKFNNRVTLMLPEDIPEDATN